MTRAVLIGVLAALLVPAAGAKGEPVTPETTITAAPAKLANTRSATFKFTSDQRRAHFACSIDGGAFFTCESPYSLSAADGEHQFWVAAILPSGLADPSPAGWSWTADTVAPRLVRRRLDVGYGRLAITWGPVDAAGANQVVVTRSTDPKKEPAKEVYRGTGSRYVDPKFHNASYHRYRIVASDRAGNVAAPVDLVVGPDALLLSPGEGARVRGAAKLRWRRVPGASFYNVQVFRGGRKILSTWPRSTKLRVGRSWQYKGHRYRLTAGRYTWYVWPGFGPLAQSRYGRLLGQSSFVV